jgi:hypothetical protein
MGKRSEAAVYRLMAEAARVLNARDALIKLADRLDALADQCEQERLRGKLRQRGTPCGLTEIVFPRMVWRWLCWAVATAILALHPCRHRRQPCNSGAAGIDARTTAGPDRLLREVCELDLSQLDPVLPPKDFGRD